MEESLYLHASASEERDGEPYFRQKAIHNMASEISKILIDNRPSIYLYGSAVLNDFRLGWSDIDILVLTQQRISPQQAKELVMLRQKRLENEPNNHCVFQRNVAYYIYQEINTGKWIGGVDMNYEIRHFDTPLLRFSATEDTSSPEIQVLWQDDEKRDLFPLDLSVSGEGIAKWLKHRTVPKNRAYVHNFLSKCGLNLNRPLNIIKVSKGLSLNDCYWVVEEGFCGSFAHYNLYDNRFSQILALIAFTGYGSSIRASLASSPEFTTNGMLPKCWRRQNGRIILYKGGTSGASNAGNEPYSEYYAYQVAQIMGIDAIPYGLSKWKGELCSTCDLFTSKEYSFLPVGRVVTTGGMEAVRAYYHTLGQDFVKALHDMLVLDALIYNTDRHFGNFGFLVDNNTNRIAAPAPLFDHGNALFNYAGKDDLSSDGSLQRYADTLLPCVYDDFAANAKQVLTPDHKEGLRRLLTFRFKKHSRYNLPDARLKQIEKQVQKRAAELLG